MAHRVLCAEEERRALCYLLRDDKHAAYMFHDRRIQGLVGGSAQNVLRDALRRSYIQSWSISSTKPYGAAGELTPEIYGVKLLIENMKEFKDTTNAMAGRRFARNWNSQLWQREGGNRLHALLWRRIRSSVSREEIQAWLKLANEMRCLSGSLTAATWGSSRVEAEQDDRDMDSLQNELCQIMMHSPTLADCYASMQHAFGEGGVDGITQCQFPMAHAMWGAEEELMALRHLLPDYKLEAYTFYDRGVEALIQGPAQDVLRDALRRSYIESLSTTKLYGAASEFTPKIHRVKVFIEELQEFMEAPRAAGGLCLTRRLHLQMWQRESGKRLHGILCAKIRGSASCEEIEGWLAIAKETTSLMASLRAAAWGNINIEVDEEDDDMDSLQNKLCHITEQSSTPENCFASLQDAGF